MEFSARAAGLAQSATADRWLCLGKRSQATARGELPTASELAGTKSAKLALDTWQVDEARLAVQRTPTSRRSAPQRARSSRRSLLPGRRRLRRSVNPRSAGRHVFLLFHFSPLTIPC